MQHLEDQFIVGFRPSDEKWATLNRSRIRPGTLELMLVGQKYDEAESQTNANMRGFVSVHPVFVNPGTGNEVVIGTDRFVELTTGPRSGLIVFHDAAKASEAPKPVSRFWWEEDIPEDLREAVDMLIAAGAEKPAQSYIKWPTFYTAVDKRRYPTGMRPEAVRRLNKIVVPDFSKMSDTERVTAQDEVHRVLGAIANMTQPIVSRFWSTLQRHKGELLACIDYVMVPKNSTMLACLPLEPVQRLPKRHVLDTSMLSGRHQKIRFDLMRLGYDDPTG